MYNEDKNNLENKKGFSVTVDLVVKFLFVALFIFLAIWLLPKFFGLFGSSNNDKNTNGGNVNVNVNLEPLLEQIYADNINTMKTAAKGYFTTERLPQNFGDEVKMTLQQMLDLNLLLPLVDRNGELCDANESYVVMTKLETEYKLDTHLTCSGETKVVTEYLGCYDYCITGVCSNQENKVCTETNVTRYKFKKTLYQGQRITKAGSTQYEYLPTKEVNYYQGTKTVSGTKTQYEQAEYTLKNTYKYTLYKEVVTPGYIYLMERKIYDAPVTSSTTEYQHVKSTSSSDSSWVFDYSFVSYSNVGSAPANTKYVGTGVTSLVSDSSCGCTVTGTVYEVYKEVVSSDSSTSYVWRTKIDNTGGWTHNGITRTTTTVKNTYKTEQKAFDSKEVEGWYYTNKYSVYDITKPVYAYNVYEADLQKYLDQGYIKQSRVSVTQKIATGNVIWTDTKTTTGNYLATGNTREVNDGTSTVVTSDIVTDKQVLLNQGYKNADIKVVDTKVETYGTPVWLSTAGPVDGYQRTSTPPKVINEDVVETTDFMTLSEWNKKVKEGYKLSNTKTVYTTSISSSLNGWTNTGSYVDVVKNCETVSK